MFFTHAHQQQLIVGNQTFQLPCSSPRQLFILHTTFKYTKKRAGVQFNILAEIAACTHFWCQGWHVQSASHTLGRGFHTPNSEGGSDSWCAMPPAHIVDASVGWSQLLRPHPGQWCGHYWWHVQQECRGWRVGTSETFSQTKSISRTDREPPKATVVMPYILQVSEPVRRI